MAVVFRSGMSLGSMSAEDDERFLRDCFISTDVIHTIKDLECPQCILLGRTGSGKSAILWDVEETCPNVIRINPESLSINYISNSNILKAFEDLDIKLDVFYQLLWRHILVVELIKAKQSLHTESQAKSWIAALFQRLGENPKKKRALEYLFQFGSSFWADTEARIREVVSNIERRFVDESGIDLSAGPIKLKDGAKGEDKQAQTVTQEIIHKAQKVVNQVQIQELENVIDLLAEDIFDDRYSKYYIIIDDLDRDWAHDQIRFKLVRALIETIKKFRRIRNLKIIISMRADLLQTVMEKTSTAGFQREKYEDLFLRLQWNHSQLRDLADKRVNHLFRDQYTNRTVGLNEIIANRVGDKEAFEYILERTLERPRDVISYLNECLITAAGQTILSNKVIRDSEINYSTKRMASLADEWKEVYGDIEPALRALKVLGSRFEYKDIDKDRAESFSLMILDAAPDDLKGRCFAAECNAYASGTLSQDGLRSKLITVFYIVGAIGVKVNPTTTYEWSYRNSAKLDISRLNDSSKFAIHPMLFKALGVYADPKTIS